MASIATVIVSDDNSFKPIDLSYIRREASKYTHIFCGHNDLEVIPYETYLAFVCTRCGSTINVHLELLKGSRAIESQFIELYKLIAQNVDSTYTDLQALLEK